MGRSWPSHAVLERPPLMIFGCFSTNSLCPAAEVGKERKPAVTIFSSVCILCLERILSGQGAQEGDLGPRDAQGIPPCK